MDQLPVQSDLLTVPPFLGPGFFHLSLIRPEVTNILRSRFDAAAFIATSGRPLLAARIEVALRKEFGGTYLACAPAQRV